ncbi:hypothetical protein D3H64_08260 [Atopobacter sp. AH10]|nr:hypothetical protein D3H64_08260 [Atopobacter sp. AH10]
MFFGDMLLYYDKNDYEEGKGLDAIVAIMKDVSVSRLYIGGLIGPIAAFFYIIGFTHILLIAKPSWSYMAIGIFSLNAVGICCGGAYHSHCAYLGLLSRLKVAEAFETFLAYLKVQAKLLFILMGLANVGLTCFIGLGATIFPRWLALFTPICLMALTPVVGKLPKGFHILIRGGWTNIVFIIYYGMALWLMR